MTTPTPPAGATGGTDATTGGGATSWSSRPDASMTLLNEMMHRPLDPSYAAEAAVRQAAGKPASHTRPLRMGVVTFLIGLLLVTAAQNLRQPKDAVAGQKAALIAQIRSAQQQADTLAAQQTRLQAQVANGRRDTLDEQDQSDLANRLQEAEVVAGSAAVTGPGVVLTIDNAKHAAGGGPDGDPRSANGSDMGKIVSRDLQIVVNGLWSAGAEAIAINGQRLTSTAAVRFAGDAILVDYRPLARPYVVTAIGDPGALERDFTHSDGGQYVQGLADSYGIRYEHTTKDQLSVPGGGSGRLRHAAPLTATAPPTQPRSTSPTPSETAP